MGLSPRQRIIVVSGGRGAGKTTLCQRTAEAAFARHTDTAGLLSPARCDAGVKTGINVTDLRSEESRLLASKLAGEVKGFSIGPWTFDDQVYAWAGGRLALADPSQLLIIDELGPLEFEQNKDWSVGLRLLEQGRYDLALVVVRPECMNLFTQRFPEARPVSLDTDTRELAFQTVADEMDRIPPLPDMPAVILAAGGSSRMGMTGSKVLLEWQGDPLVRRAAQVALNAGLSPVVVVAGSAHMQVREALTGMDVTVVHNADWQQGQSTSLRAGLNVIGDHTPGTCFMLADQPFVTSRLLLALRTAFTWGSDPILMPIVNDRRGNPVIVSAALYPELLELRGDAGGRQLFGRHDIATVNWPDKRLLLDVDTREDFERLSSAG